jgi:hypothetical protein
MTPLARPATIASVAGAASQPSPAARAEALTEEPPRPNLTAPPQDANAPPHPLAQWRSPPATASDDYENRLTSD